MADQKPLNIYQKLVEVRKTVKYLQKEKKGQQYQYVGSSQVLGAVREKMDDLSLLLIVEITDKNLLVSSVEYKDNNGNVNKITNTYFTELNLMFTWVNAENPSETIKIPFYSQGVDIAGEKGVGKALTYAEKYFLLKQFNIATDKDDPDAHQKQPEPNQQQQRQQYEQQKQEQQQENNAKPANQKQINYIKSLSSQVADVYPQKTKDDVYEGLVANNINIHEPDKISSGQASAAIKLLQGWLSEGKKKQEEAKKQSA